MFEGNWLEAHNLLLLIQILLHLLPQLQLNQVLMGFWGFGVLGFWGHQVSGNLVS